MTGRSVTIQACADSWRTGYSEEPAGFCREDVQGGFEARDGLFEPRVAIELGTKVPEQGVGFTNLLLGVASGLLGRAGRMSFHGILLCYLLCLKDPTTKVTKGHEGCSHEGFCCSEMKKS